MFLSLREHVRHWSNPLGRCFFQTERDDRTTPVWRAPEGTTTAPASGCRAWPGNTQTPQPIGGHRRDRRARLRRPWAVAGPGRASRRRAERSSRRGRRAGGPPPTGAPSSPARQVRPSGARNTSGATSAARTRAERNPYSPRNALIAGISRTACTRPAR